MMQPTFEMDSKFKERLQEMTEKSMLARDWLALVEHQFNNTDSALNLLNQADAAKTLNVSGPTFRKMLQTDPNLPRYKVGNTLRFNKAALLNYLVQASTDWTSHMDMIEGLAM